MALSGIKFGFSVSLCFENKNWWKNWMNAEQTIKQNILYIILDYKNWFVVLRGISQYVIPLFHCIIFFFILVKLSYIFSDL